MQWQPVRDWEFLQVYEFWAAGRRFTQPGHPVNAPPQAITTGDLALLSFQPLLTATQVSLAFPFLLWFYKSFFSVGSQALKFSTAGKKNWEREGRLVKVVLEKGFQEKVGRRWLDKCYLSVFLSEGFGASFHVVKSNDTENSFTFTIGISFWVGHHKLLSMQSTLSLSSWDTCSHAGIDLPCDPPLSLQYNLLYHNRSWPKWHLLRQFIKVCTDAFGIEACFCQPTKKWIHIVITDMIFIYYYL